MDIGSVGEIVWSRLSDDDAMSLALMVAVIAAVLYLRRPEERTSLRNTLGLCVLGFAGVVAAEMLAAFSLGTAGGVVREAGVVLAGLAIIRLWGQFLFRVLLPLARMTPPRILEDLVVIVAYVSWGLVRLRLAGLDLSGIVATSAVITAIIAFSIQDTLGNILGGLALELDSAFGIGDWIKVDDLVGQVVDIRWRSVSIQTRNWETVIVPNSHMVRSKVLVLGQRLGAPRQWRRWIRFSVAYSAAPARVIAAVEAALKAAAIPHVATDPAPNCVLVDFDAGFGRYAVRYWLTEIAQDDLTDSKVREHVLAALQRSGMRVAVAEHNVHVVSEDRAHAKQVAQRELERRMKSVRSVELFAELTADEVRTLAARLEPVPFVAGDAITRQGAVAHWLYILASGSVEVVLERPGQAAHRLAQLEAPTVFGEMGLLTGEPRHATVTATSSIECYRLEKAAFEEVLLKRPALAERMARILAARQEDFEREVNHLAAHARNAEGSRLSDEILGKIKRFFSIASA
ncbi:MAG: mechanosensitive ion channel [Burkholderiales bacterium]|nr:mechanosensitive ion channel [Burkholderiales bacterium]